MLKRPFKIVVAQTRQRGIGLNGDIPWPRLNLDMARFAKITKQTAKPDTMNAVIMGRRTWESIPDKYRPLPERYNVVISSQSTSDLIASTKAATTSNTTVASSFEEAMKLLSSEPISSKIENVYVIGGGQVYQTAIAHPQCQEVSDNKICISKCFTLYDPFVAALKIATNICAYQSHLVLFHCPHPSPHRSL